MEGACFHKLKGKGGMRSGLSINLETGDSYMTSATSVKLAYCGKGTMPPRLAALLHLRHISTK